ncbi:ComF family protein [Candidatus Symbiobacter mobilis]|uniref:Amidophosphoribosyltransferase-like protein n=1 Tax=Candidatus Symbiobacter mobilis CR TaxID=946483 RepID=U5N7L7_9BURK|nr:phosphoribosyltransferase family protein [Candidatus Symbiobacter mobilis]AGX86189.1 amidophosphoribosyltransferase-like protein [Candidatus Symbiobacter mobilis CR]
MQPETCTKDAQDWWKRLPHRALQAVAKMGSLCHVCHRWPQEPVCDACLRRFAVPEPRCATCALPSTQPQCGACLTDPPELNACVAAVSYAFPWSNLVASFKFRGDTGLAACLAQRMRDAPGAGEMLDSSDWLLPIPMSAQRLRERGYNQALLLARALDAQCTPTRALNRVRFDMLCRVRETPALRTMDRAQRRAAVAHALAIDPLHLRTVRGARVVLIDDVMTTGATLDAAARVLREAGAAHIAAVVVARTPRPSPAGLSCF